MATHFYALLQGGFPLPVKLAFGSPSACYLQCDDPRWRNVPAMRVPVFPQLVLTQARK